MASLSSVPGGGCDLPPATPAAPWLALWSQPAASQGLPKPVAKAVLPGPCLSPGHGSEGMPSPRPSSATPQKAGSYRMFALKASMSNNDSKDH